MLETITVEDFKSYKKASLPLAPLTLLIGANASGKSNVIEAIRLLNWLAKGSRLDDIEKDVQKGNAIVRGRSSDLFRFNSNKITLGGNLSGAPESWNHYKISIAEPFGDLIVVNEQVTKLFGMHPPLYEIKSEASQHSDEVKVMYNNFARGGKKPQIPCSNRQAIFYQLETPGRFAKEHIKSQKIIPKVTKALRQDLSSILFLDPRPSQMREWAFPNDKEMDEDGKNLSAVLFDLVNKGKKPEILNFIQSLPEQAITDIKFLDTQRSEVMVQLEETFGDKSEDLDAGLLSDGTLRVLAIAAALLSAPEGTFVIIEEIDNGVHPSRARSLIEQVEAVAKKRKLRVLLSTHNPAMLDAVPTSALGDVVCCYRDPDEGDSRLVRLKDLDRYPELVAQGTLGDLVTTRVIDQFLKDKSTSEDRKESAKVWLNEYKTSTEEGNA